MQTTREQIIDYLQDKHLASAIELSRELMITPANIRHHLSILGKQGYVELAGIQPPHKRGRPRKLYRLALHKQMDGIVDLAKVILKEINRNSTRKEYIALLKNIGNELVGEPRVNTLPLINSLNLLIEKLNQRDYNGRWEAHAQGPRILLGNCPYASIVDEHPELCLMDQLILEDHLNRKVHLDKRMERTPRGQSYCTFKL